MALSENNQPVGRQVPGADLGYPHLQHEDGRGFRALSLPPDAPEHGPARWLV